jgi:hypothetical protein
MSGENGDGRRDSVRRVALESIHPVASEITLFFAGLLQDDKFIHDGDIKRIGHEIHQLHTVANISDYYRQKNGIRDYLIESGMPSNKLSYLDALLEEK